MLVLGGEGNAGKGVFAELIRGLFERGVHLRSADHMVGTSAGTAIAAWLWSTQPIESLFARQSDPALIANEPARSAEAQASRMSAHPAIMALAHQQLRLMALDNNPLVPATPAPSVFTGRSGIAGLPIRRRHSRTRMVRSAEAPKRPY